MITIPDWEKRAIAEAAHSVCARRILEIGAFKGETTALLSRLCARHGGYVVVVDPMRWASKPASFGELVDAWVHPFSYEQAFWKNVNQVGHGNVRLHRRLSTDPDFVRDPAPELKEFDLAIVDGEHTYSTVLSDLKNWGTRVRQGGLILCHDVRDRFPGVKRAFAEFGSQNGYLATWPKRGSLGILRRV
ncbi:MAG TPA: class I SAM-dependent methyltransferase [Bdellovibrionota bacterium]|nr:class I SAM-dependent methyltransferase [Bdellovibrionota bacterium]